MATIDPQIKAWTRDEYYSIASAGLFEGQRVELIEGEILTMSPMNAAHAAALQLTAKALEAAFGEPFSVRVQLPLSLASESEPEPDLAVVPGKPRDYKVHPCSALLIVEISDTTLRFDRERKRRLYARAGIQEYWIVNLLDRCLEVHRHPSADDYSTVISLAADQSIQPLAAPNAISRLADLLP